MKFEVELKCADDCETFHHFRFEDDLPLDFCLGVCFQTCWQRLMGEHSDADQLGMSPEDIAKLDLQVRLLP